MTTACLLCPAECGRTMTHRGRRGARVRTSWTRGEAIQRTHACTATFTGYGAHTCDSARVFCARVLPGVHTQCRYSWSGKVAVRAQVPRNRTHCTLQLIVTGSRQRTGARRTTPPHLRCSPLACAFMPDMPKLPNQFRIGRQLQNTQYESTILAARALC